MKNFKRTAWSDQQVDLLKKFYGDLSIDDLTTMLGKTKSAIYSKVHYLRKRGWTFKWRSSTISTANSVNLREKYRETENLKNVEIVCITKNLPHEEETLLMLPNVENFVEEWQNNFPLAKIVYISEPNYNFTSEK